MTWVVSDLETKLDIQAELFKRYEFLPEDAVLRASELWQKIFIFQRPDYTIISLSLFETLLQDWMTKRKIEWAQGAGAVRALGFHLQQFLPLFLNEELDQQFRVWLTENQNAFLRLGSWYFLAREAWSEFAVKKMAPVTWVPTLMLETSAWSQTWPREFIFDLEAQLTGQEVEIIKSLARDHKVNVITPDKNWRDKHSKVLWPYSVLLDEAIPLQRSGHASENSSNIQIHRWTTPIAEVQGVTAQVRDWLDAGVEPGKIAIFAPDIELYWPSIKAYFKVEGIPLRKDTVTAIQNFKDVSSWISRLRVDSKNFESTDLQGTLYSTTRKAKLSFSEFRALYANIFDEADLKRSEEIQSYFDLSLSHHSVINRNQFVSWSLARWDLNFAYDRIEKIIALLMAEAGPQLQLTLASWIAYLEKIASKLEVRTEYASAESVAFFNFGSSLQEKYEKCYIIGLSDDAVKSNANAGLSTGDIQKIGNDLGVYLDHPDKSEAEYYADYISSGTLNDRQVVLSFAATAFSGEAQAPALFWLEAALKQKVDLDQYSEIKKTRWQEKQHLTIEKLTEFSELNASLGQTVQEDLDLKAIEPTKLSRKPSLSASQVERYLTCPFIFLAEKIFKLEDHEEVDFDIDRRSRGRLQHAVLERLLEPPVHFDWTEEDLLKLIDQIKLENEIFVSDERLWPYIRRQYLVLAVRFLEFEKAFAKEYPSNKNIGRELDFEVGYSPSKKTFVVKDEISANDYLFRGKIDRVDGDAGRAYVVIDYKATKTEKVTNATSWIKDQSLQLALYSQIIEAGLTRLPKAPVIAAFFYVLRTFDRKTGFHLADLEPTYFETQDKKKNKISEEAKQKIYLESAELLQSVVVGIEEGRLSPNPRDADKDCPKCKWRSTCRAPHLI
jgi:RecB family exonuclease